MPVLRSTRTNVYELIPFELGDTLTIAQVNRTKNL